MLTDIIEIPQTAPFRLVDRVVHHDGITTICGFTPLPGGVLVANGHFTPEGMIESLAQTSAVRASIMYNFSSQIGYFAVLKNLLVKKLPAENREFLAEIVFTGDVVGFQILKCRILQQEESLLECELRIFAQNHA